MLVPDPRAYRVALIADAVVNDEAAGFDALGMLDAADWGIVVLPPSDFPSTTLPSIVEYVVDDLCDYSREGYRVVIVGSSAIEGFGIWEDLLVAELERRGHPGFERFDVAGATALEFAAFLSARDPSALR